MSCRGPAETRGSAIAPVVSASATSRLQMNKTNWPYVTALSCFYLYFIFLLVFVFYYLLFIFYFLSCIFRFFPWGPGQNLPGALAPVAQMREALSAITHLEARELEQFRYLRLLTDSKSGLQLLRRGAAGQTMALAADVWKLLNELATEKWTARSGGSRATLGSTVMRLRTFSPAMPRHSGRQPYLSTLAAPARPSSATSGD